MSLFLTLATLAAAAPDPDPLTVTAIAVTTYTTAALLHEGVGHEGGCLLGGGRPLGFSTVVAGCDATTPGQNRWVSAGGAASNLMFGAGFGATLAFAPPRNGAMYDFLWTQTVVNLWQGTGYLMVGPWIPVGDWGTGGFLADIRRPLPAQIGLSAAGLAGTFAVVPLANHLGKPLFGSAGSATGRGRTLTILPYVAGATFVTATGLLCRLGPEYAVSGAVANFAGTLFLAYLPLFFSADVFVPGKEYTGERLVVEREPVWWVVGGIAAVTAVAVFGPGVGAFEQN
jgi:hypothetical protein